MLKKSFVKIFYKRVNKILSYLDLDERVTRIIKIDPRYRQTIVGTINYFSEIIEQKFPNENIFLNIDQSGKDTIKFSITAEDGKLLESVEKALDDYNLVIKKEKPVEELLSDPNQIIAFETKMELLKTELTMTNKLLLSKEKEVTRLEETVDRQDKLIHDY